MKDWFVPVVVAVLVCAALLYALAVSLEPPSALPTTSRPVAVDPPRAGDGRSNASSVPAPVAAVPAQPDVTTLRARCVRESRSGRGLTQALSSACREYADASRRELPPPSAARPPPSVESQAPALQPRPLQEREGGLPYITVVLNQCEDHRYGTIDYRRCRARESERLRHECQRFTQEAAMASGERRQRLRTYARSYCRESDQYRVID